MYAFKYAFKKTKFLMRFAVFTHVIHQEKEGRYYAYSPYVREMNLWFRHVEEVEVVAPLEFKGNGEKETGGQGELYIHPRITFSKIPSFHLLNFPAVLDSLIKIPIIFFKILGAMSRADHLHLRCPGNIGFLAVIAQIFFPKKPKTVKYAGNWDPKSKQPGTYRLQKWILSNIFLSRNIKVLVYGDWPGQSKNIVPFFTASFSEKDREVVEKDFTPPYNFIYTGNLVEGKGVFEAIEFIESLKTKGVESKLEIYGDGILKDSLRDYIQRNELQEFVKLKGRKSLEELKGAYKKAHFVILLSKSEGWPKTIAEGMWYGCVPVATDVSCISWVLGEGRRGILVGSGFRVQGSKFNVSGSNGVEDESLVDIVRKLRAVIENPEERKRMSLAAQEWSQQYTLERFEKAIQGLLKNKKRAHNPQLTTDNPKPQTPNNKLTPDANREQNTTHNRQPTTHNSVPTTQNPQPTTDNPEPTTDNNKQQTINSKHLRVIQLVDTLNPGGAERMAVNLANSLVGEVEASYLCCTRGEGMLKEELEEGVEYLYLDKKHSLDLQAFLKLRAFVKREEIDLVHAHGTSWFWGVLLKMSGLNIKLVWHDHYGESEQLDRRDTKFLKPLSRYFDGIISVNNDLMLWAEKELKARNVTQLNNFIVPSENKDSKIKLKGKSTDFKIICVANLRPQKDHFNLLAAFEKLQGEEISLHLFGLNPVTAWSKKVLDKIVDLKNVYYYGGLAEVSGLLRQADLGVLSSGSEGLPLALLEYGLAGLPVVCTDVGQCREVTGEEALLVPAGDASALADAIKEYYYKSERRKKDAHDLHIRIKNDYSREAVLPLFLEFYANLSEK